ncbi:hypothetical protein VTL71DRAFT_3804 [Oculimacula yallundae]|uniref:Uncharacterized protein n=1 Tax=Oculimacula yallundae TaxID=86028 RepID=A0ABR4C5R2_9HELO
MTITNYQEIPIANEHGAQDYDNLRDWRVLGAAEKIPRLENYKVTAENLEATMACNVANGIIALDNLGHVNDNKKVPEAYMSELVIEFARRRGTTPKFIVVNNMVEPSTKKAMVKEKMKKNGLLKIDKPAHWAIVKDTKIGKMARRAGGAITGIYALELEKRDEALEGPSLIFLYGDVPSGLKPV